MPLKCPQIFNFDVIPSLFNILLVEFLPSIFLLILYVFLVGSRFFCRANKLPESSGLKRALFILGVGKGGPKLPGFPGEGITSLSDPR